MSQRFDGSRCASPPHPPPPARPPTPTHSILPYPPTPTHTACPCMCSGRLHAPGWLFLNRLAWCRAAGPGAAAGARCGFAALGSATAPRGASAPVWGSRSLARPTPRRFFFPTAHHTHTRARAATGVGIMLNLPSRPAQPWPAPPGPFAVRPLHAAARPGPALGCLRSLGGGQQGSKQATKPPPPAAAGVSNHAAEAELRSPMRHNAPHAGRPAARRPPQARAARVAVCEPQGIIIISGLRCFDTHTSLACPRSTQRACPALLVHTSPGWLLG